LNVLTIYKEHQSRVFRIRTSAMWHSLANSECHRSENYSLQLRICISPKGERADATHSNERRRRPDSSWKAHCVYGVVNPLL